jgi:hypothetical protein
MSAHRFQHLLRALLPALLLAVAAVGPAAADLAKPAAEPMPSASAFDTLFARLDVGDLTSRDAAAQRVIEKQLQQLLPSGDAHRRRLLDTVRCNLDFVNATQDGFAFADAKLAEALSAHDDSAAIRFYDCRGG